MDQEMECGPFESQQGSAGEAKPCQNGNNHDLDICSKNPQKGDSHSRGNSPDTCGNGATSSIQGHLSPDGPSKESLFGTGSHRGGTQSNCDRDSVDGTYEDYASQLENEGESFLLEPNDSINLDIDEPPDGGFGWVVCACSFFLQLICDGLLFSFGVLYISLLEHFEEGKSTTSWVGAVFMGCSMLMGPLAGALAGKIGCRITAMLGSVIACVSLVISTFSPNIGVLALTYGAMAGTGISLVYLVSVVMVGSYFKKRRALANGIAMCGSGIGTFIMSPLLRYLLDEYGWDGTILILAGIALNCCVFSAFFRPLTPKRAYKSSKTDFCSQDEEIDDTVSANVSEICDKNEVTINSKKDKLHINNDTEIAKDKDVPKTDSGYASNGHIGKTITTSPIKKEELPRGLGTRRTSSLTDLTKYKMVQNKRLMALKSEHLLSQPQLSNKPYASSSKSLSVHSRILRNIITTQSLVDTYWGKENVSTMSRREIFISGSAWTIPRVRAQDSQSDRHSISVRCSQNEIDSKTCSCKDAKQTLRKWFYGFVDAFGLPLLRDPILLLIVLSCVFWTGQSTIYTYLVDFALYQGVDKHNSAFLLSIIGITNTVARIAIGWITDHPQIDSTLVYASALIMSGIIAFAIPFCESFIALAVCSAVFGICMATYVSLRSIIVVDLMGIDQLTGAFGLVISFQGMTYTVVPPIAGAILEATGTYMGPFVSAGAFYTLAALVVLPIQILKGRRRRIKKHAEDVLISSP